MTCTVEATKNSVRRLTSPVEGHVPPHNLSRDGPEHSFTWVTRLSDSDSDDSAHFDPSKIPREPITNKLLM